MLLTQFHRSSHQQVEGPNFHSQRWKLLGLLWQNFFLLRPVEDGHGVMRGTVTVGHGCPENMVSCVKSKVNDP